MNTNPLGLLKAGIFAARPSALLTAVTHGRRPVLPAAPPATGAGTAGNESSLALTDVAGNITFVGRDATAWFALYEQPWDFRTHGDLNALIEENAAQFAHLNGRWLHLRRTTMAFPVDDWAEHMDRTTTACVPTEAAWLADQAATVEHVRANAAPLGITLLGVSLERPGPAQSKDRDAALAALAEQARLIGDMLADGGMLARPATERELSWMIVRSVILGLDPPAESRRFSHPDDILGLADLAEHFREHRWASTTRILDRRTGNVRHVAVLTIGRMEELHIPETHEPWLAYAAQLPFPVEISCRVAIVNAEKSVSLRVNMMRHQKKDNDNHGINDPRSLDRALAQGEERLDQIQTGLPAKALSAHGWFRLAVAGDTEAECLDRVREITRHYAIYNITVEHSRDQAELLREFIPGEPVANNGYIRRMELSVLAGAMPQASSPVGDDRGDFLGFTAGKTAANRPVFFDPNLAPMLDESGLTVLIGKPGSGKSTLMGLIGYLAASRGALVTILDPSGPLARLATVPGMEKFVQVINLASSRKGRLSPFALIPPPRLADFPDTEQGRHEYEDAADIARIERRVFARDILLMLLPAGFAERDQYVITLTTALRRVPAKVTTTVEDVIEQLKAMAGERDDETAENLANLLLDAGESPLARQFFGQPDKAAYVYAPLNVITMPGLQIPDLSIPRAYWTHEQTMAVPMLHAGMRFAVRRAYDGDPSRRKVVGLDEAHILLDGWESGRSFFTRLSRDSRKNNIGVIAASQNPLDILGLDWDNLVSSVFVGHISDGETIIGQALEMLHLPAGAGWEQELAQLSRSAASRRGNTTDLPFREFLYRDMNGRLQKIRVDLNHLPALLAALNTSPGGTR